MVIPQAAKEKYGALYDALNADMTYNAIHESNALYAEEHLAGREMNNHHKGRSHSHKNTERDYITYKVHRGDTLKVIANKFDGTSVAEIKELNGLKDSHLQPGMTLKINKG
jgi:membrane-bound lytic murein transglycosylase D